MRVLNCAFPFAKVSQDTSGGAEQIVWLIDYFFSFNGIHSLVIASEESEINGNLIPLNYKNELVDEDVKAKVYHEYLEKIYYAIKNNKPDLIHFHGLDFDNYLPETRIPLLVTLHLPLDFYKPDGIQSNRYNLYFNAVSDTQRESLKNINISDVIHNGIDIRNFIYNEEKRNYYLCLGRICPEKGYDILLNELKNTGTQLIIAGELFKYSYHNEFYRDKIEPHLDDDLRWIGPADSHQKRELLSDTKCLIIPSTVDETSSLSAMEALASGTPVIAMNKGALPEIIKDGLTGIIINDIREIHDALKEIEKIKHQECRKEAESRFDFRDMARSYLNLYGKILAE